MDVAIGLPFLSHHVQLLVMPGRRDPLCVARTSAKGRSRIVGQVDPALRAGVVPGSTADDTQSCGRGRRAPGCVFEDHDAARAIHLITLRKPRRPARMGLAHRGERVDRCAPQAPRRKSLFARRAQRRGRRYPGKQRDDWRRQSRGTLCASRNAEADGGRDCTAGSRTSAGMPAERRLAVLDSGSCRACGDFGDGRAAEALPRAPQTPGKAELGIAIVEAAASARGGRYSDGPQPRGTQTGTSSSTRGLCGIRLRRLSGRSIRKP